MTATTDAERGMDAATATLQRLAGTGAPYGRRCGAEAVYGDAYEILVRQGVRIRLRGKYRRPTLRNQAGGHNNNRKSMGKHTPHPQIHGWRRDALGGRA